MEDGLILVCKYADKICPILVKSDMNFGAVMEKICRRWTSLDPDTLIMTYSLIDNESIVMEDDVGLATLWELAQAGAMNDIEVVVEDGSLEFTMADPDSNSGPSSGRMSQIKKRNRTSNMDDGEMITPLDFSVVFCIVDSENRDNWLWFLQQLYSIIDHGRRFTFVSDRNLGLLEAMKTAFPTSPHGYCLYHLTFNLRYHLRGTPKGYRETMVHLLRLAAHAPTSGLFHHFILRMATEGGEKVMDFLKNLPVENWSTVHFPGCRYGEMYSNVAESFNSWIKDKRYLPIRNLVDAIRVKIMDMIVERSKKASEWGGKFCPKVEQKLYDSFQESRTWVVLHSGNDVFEVQSSLPFPLILWQEIVPAKNGSRDGFPCCHAVGVIASAGKDLGYYVDPYYYAETYRASYSYPIHPIPTLWMPRNPTNEDVILPPLSKKPLGRPKSRRIPSRGEKVSQIGCGRCHKLGNHNRSTCKEAM